jgi:hypothetical protein
MSFLYGAIIQLVILLVVEIDWYGISETMRFIHANYDQLYLKFKMTLPTKYSTNTKLVCLASIVHMEYILSV